MLLQLVIADAKIELRVVVARILFDGIAERAGRVLIHALGEESLAFVSRLDRPSDFATGQGEQ